jgi:hypothetical protein
MNSKRKPYKTYTKEFKVEAIRLMNVSDRPSSELAAQLGIRRNQLYKWKSQLEDTGDKAFSNNLGRPRKGRSFSLPIFLIFNRFLAANRVFFRRNMVHILWQYTCHTINIT